MSSVHAAGKRGPGVVRAAVKISLGCVLLGGCSAGAERFTSTDFGSGYEAAPPRSSTPAVNGCHQRSPIPPRSSKQRVLNRSRKAAISWRAPAPTSRADICKCLGSTFPLFSNSLPRSSGVKTADGYGPYGPAPLSDGTYAGPRVYSPYDQPNGGYAPPAPPPAGGYAPPPSGYSPPPQGYYGGGSRASAPPPPRIREAGLMAIRRSRRISKMAADMIARRPQDYAYYGPDQGNARARGWQENGKALRSCRCRCVARKDGQACAG